MSKPTGSAPRLPGGQALEPSLFGDEPEVQGPQRAGKSTVVALALGIVSVLLILILPLYGLIIALIALYLGIRAVRRKVRGTLVTAAVAVSVFGLVGNGLMTTAEWNATKSCKSIPTSDTTPYQNCIKQNLRL
ncbi:hypothetical protein KDL01_13700 [Actinospica durhamensis]|uniref:DUF4190 domain-containing protein n=1 Tax=Actinospica durhamensis TaxID=1508375 RepID=A0A941ENI2_9ACTN|nr:hypothetical protein [Actinospica durhamensis]MBR7834325.1 hypothetical protein [Actinospica durhamensis]